MYLKKGGKVGRRAYYRGSVIEKLIYSKLLLYLLFIFKVNLDLLFQKSYTIQELKNNTREICMLWFNFFPINCFNIFQTSLIFIFLCTVFITIT